MKASDIKELTLEDIQAKLKEEKEAYEKLRLNHKMAQIENPVQLRYLRKNIARLNTELSKKTAENKQA